MIKNCCIVELTLSRVTFCLVVADGWKNEARTLFLDPDGVLFSSGFEPRKLAMLPGTYSFPDWLLLKQ